MARRQHLTLTVLLAIVVLLSITYIFSGSSALSPARLLKSGRNSEIPLTADGKKPDPASKPGFEIDLEAIPDLSEGDSIAPKLENATLKAELGRATWKFLHTMVARFPDKPTDSDRKTLESFFLLFGRLYPCGDCARHFRGMLDKYPPQTSSRNAAAGWLCALHNMVNKRLEKPTFDCTKIGDFYDCGCGDDKKEADKKEADKKEADKKEADKGEEEDKKQKVTRDEGGDATIPGLGGLDKQWSKAIEGL
ncbi:ERV2 protein-like protein [Metarhizium brunneum]